MRKSGAALTAVCAALAGAGCGEDQEFIDDYNEATKPLQEIETELGGAQSGADGGGRRLTRLADEAKKVNDDLADLEAPDDAKADFDDLRAALRKSEGDMRALARASESDDITKLTSATEALARDAAAIDRAESAVKRKVED